jgi:hypothetical protein
VGVGEIHGGEGGSSLDGFVGEFPTVSREQAVLAVAEADGPDDGCLVGFGCSAFAASYAEGALETEIQIVSNAAGEATAVIVPIALWKEIAAERETAYLLKSDAMRQRLLGALERESGVPLEDAVAKLEL